MKWAKISDCGNALLTFFDVNVALKQLDKTHQISDFVKLNLHCLGYEDAFDFLFPALNFLKAGELPKRQKC